MKEAHPQISNYQRLFRIGLTVLRHRRMSAQEAAYRLSNLQMVSMSRKTVYLNARTLANRFRMLKKECLHMDRAETDVFVNNLLDYYRSRPQLLEDLSFYSFAAWYQRSEPPSSTQTSRAEPRFYIARYDLYIRNALKLL